MRSADTTFVSRESRNALTDKQQEKSPPLCPDFVIELIWDADRPKSDSLTDTKEKMLIDWMANGCQLGWLIDPFSQMVHIYRADGSIQINRTFSTPLSGENVLPGLAFDLSELVAWTRCLFATSIRLVNRSRQSGKAKS